MEKAFRRDIRALDEIFAFVETFLDRTSDTPAIRFNVSLIVEELFTNMVRHAGDGRQPIAVGLERREDGVLIRLTDYQVAPWDPTLVPAFDRDQPLDQRVPGGMGLHLVRSLSSVLTYEHRDGNSIITALTQ